jgi:membrane protease YdiL (CAAX protease family)
MTPTSIPSPSPEGLQPSFGKGIALFLVLAFSLAWCLEALMALFGGLRGRAAPAILLAVMFVPGVASVLARVATHDSWDDAGLRLGRPIGYPLAWAAILALVAATTAITWVLWPGSTDLSALRQVEELHLPWQVLFLLVVVAAPALNFLPALGEELGWRGYLLPKMLFLGELQASLASGAIWGLWHAPVIVQGYNFPRHPVAGIAIMVVGCALLGGVMGWLRLRSDSVFPPALAHGTLNAVAGVPLAIMPTVDTAYGGLLLGMAGWLPMAIVLVALVGAGQLGWKQKRQAVS